MKIPADDVKRHEVKIKWRKQLMGREQQVMRIADEENS